MATEKKNVTGLDLATDKAQAEYDLVSSLLEAADFKNDEDSIARATIKRNGKFMFAVRLHPLSDSDVRLARKKSTERIKNPNGKKLPSIAGETDNHLLASWLIYLATVEEDQEKIWGNPAVMQRYSLSLPVESIDVLLKSGEKDMLMDTVAEISGMDDGDDEENMSPEEFAKN